MTDDNEVYTPAQFREHQDGYGVRDPEAHPHAGMVRDEKVSRYMAIVGNEYDPMVADDPGRMPGQASDLSEMRELRRIGATETARAALDAGDMPTLKHLTGDQTERADVSGLKAIGKIDQIIESPAPVLVVIGEMGAGKTDFASLLGQRARHILGVEKVASNIQSLRETDSWTDQEGEERDGFVPDFSTMEDWVQQDGDPLDNSQSSKLFIGDEFSSVASGSGKSGYMTRKKMGPLVFKIRKYGGMLIYIAHDESSIHPLLWRLGVVIKKESKKKATVADRIKNGRLKGKRFTVENVPPTDWRFNTKEASSWSWTDSDGEEDPEPGEVAYDVALWTVRECKEDGLSYRDIAKYVPFSKSWVGDRWPEIEAGEHDHALDRVRAITE